MEIKELKREFRYNGVKLGDPNADFTLAQVRDFYATVYPEIVSADIEGPEQVGAVHIYTFRRAVGTKGGDLVTKAEMGELVADLLHAPTAGWMPPGDVQFVLDVRTTLQSLPHAVLNIHVQRRLVDMHVGYCVAEAA